MLTFLLVWTVALGSLSIFLAGMIFPELSRKNDLIWVGVGLFYALILWANTGNIGGGLLLGQTAGISLLVWLGWQTMTQRRELTPADKQTPVPDWLQKILDVVTPLWQKAYGAIAGQLGLDAAEAEDEASESNLKSKAFGLLDKLNNKSGSTETVVEDVSEKAAAAVETVAEKVEETVETVSDKANDVVEQTTEAVEQAAEVVEEHVEEAVEAVEAEAVETEAEPPAAEPVAEQVESPVEEPPSSEEPVAEVVEEDMPAEAPPAEEPATDEAVESPEASAEEDSNWPEDNNGETDENAQEESNWPPEEPVD